MLKSYGETVCWMSRHAGAVLVVGQLLARVVDTEKKRADGVSLSAARALAQPARSKWFSVESKKGRVYMRLSEAGEAYHRRLVERRRCACPSGQ